MTFDLGLMAFRLSVFSVCRLVLSLNLAMTSSQAHADPDSFNMLQINVHNGHVHGEDHLPCDKHILSDSEAEMAGAVFHGFVNRTRSQVLEWPVTPAIPNSTDRVAITFFQPADADAFSYSIRWNLRMLGPKWALQVFYATEEDRSTLDRALGSPSFVIWTPIQIQGRNVSSINALEFNWLFVSKDLWMTIHHEHVLVFETDSMLIRKDCVEEFLDYHYVGAPWPTGEGGNGGLSLHRRSSSLKVVSGPENSALQSSPGAYHEIFSADLHMVSLLLSFKYSIAPRELEQRFSVEIIDHPNPCGFHKRWWARCDNETDVAEMMRRYILQARRTMLAEIAR